MIAITGKPFKLIGYVDAISTLPQTVISRWNSSDNSINYSFQRKDFDIYKVVQNATNPLTQCDIWIAQNPTVPIILVGDNLYYNFTNGTYKGNAPILAIAGFGIYTVVTIGVFITAQQNQGYVNDLTALANYYVEIKINYYSTINGIQSTQTTTRRGTPDSDGNLTMNIQGAIKRLMTIKNPGVPNNFFNTSLIPDWTAWCQFSISTREVYKGSSNPFQDEIVDGIPDIYYATTSVRQIQQKNGSNLAEYVPNSFDATVKAKFLSDFDEPTYFGDAFPWDISFILSEYIYSRKMVRYETIYLQGGVTQGVNQDNLGISSYFGEHKIRIAGSYASNIDKVGLNININDIAQFGYANIQYVNPNYWDLVPALPPSLVPYFAFIEKKIRIREQCYDAPVYITWKGAEGGWNYYLFGFRQTLSLDTKVVSEAIRPIDDLETAETENDYLQKSGVEGMTVGAIGVDENDLQGLKKMLLSPKVQIYKGVKPDGTIQWQTIRFLPGSFNILDTRDKSNDIELKFIYSDTKTIAQ